MCLFFLHPVSSQDVEYPLQIGNRWTFVPVFPDYPNSRWTIIVVKDSVLPNGRSYAFLRSTMPELQRCDGRKVYVYSPKYNLETVLFNFFADPGDTVGRYYWYNDTVDVILIMKGIAQFYGTDRRTWEFRCKFRHTFDMDEIWTIADSVGHYFCVGPWNRYFLYGAVINGKTFGTPDRIIEKESQLPSELILYQNYPNPFNSSTKIVYTIPQRCLISIQVFDLLGRTIRTVINRVVESGYYETQFDAAGLTTGAYLCRLVSDKQICTRMMVLSK
jgi:hypothetical protein